MPPNIQKNCDNIARSNFFLFSEFNPELLDQIMRRNMPPTPIPQSIKYDQPAYNGPLLSGGDNVNLIDRRIVPYERPSKKKPRTNQIIMEEQQPTQTNDKEDLIGTKLIKIAKLI